MLSERCSSQARRDLHRRCSDLGGDVRQLVRLQRSEAPKREEGRVGDAHFAQVTIISSSSRCTRLYSFWTQATGAIRWASSNWLMVDVAKAKVADEAALLQFRKRLELARDRSFGGAVDAHRAQVHNLDRFEPEVTQIVLETPRQVFRLVPRNP